MSQFTVSIPSLAILASSVIANHLDRVVKNTLGTDGDSAMPEEGSNGIDSKIAYIAENTYLSCESWMGIQAQRPDLTPAKIKDLIEETLPFEPISYSKEGSRWPMPGFCWPYLKFFSIEHVKGKDENCLEGKLKSSAQIAGIIVRAFEHYKNLVNLWSKNNPSAEDGFPEYVSANDYTLGSFFQMNRALALLEKESIQRILSPYIEGVGSLLDLKDIYAEFKRYLQIGPAGNIADILKEAAENGHVETVKMILEAVKNGVIILPADVRYSAGGNALMRAAKNGHVEVVAMILEEVRARVVTLPVNGLYSLGFAFWWAIEKGQVEVVEMMLEAVKNGVITLPVDGFYSTGGALRRASAKGQVEVVEMMLEAVKNGVITLPVDGFYSIGAALQRAVKNGQFEVVEMILEEVRARLVKIIQEYLDTNLPHP